MESKGGKKMSSSSKSLFNEAPLGYTIEDVRPKGGIKKFRSAAYSNVSSGLSLNIADHEERYCLFNCMNHIMLTFYFLALQCARKPS